MHKVIIDTNVFLSGLLFGGNPEKILHQWMKNKFILCISPELQAEIVNKLKHKFHASDSYINSLITSFDEQSEKYIPQTKVSLVRDPEDNFLLELAADAKADYIITGDKDLLTIKSFQSTTILTPQDFLKKLLNPDKPTD